MLILFYQKFISPLTHFLFPNHCRFTPTCSEYAKQAIIKHGLLNGTLLSAKRVIKCRPGVNYQYDPLPNKLKSK